MRIAQRSQSRSVPPVLSQNASAIAVSTAVHPNMVIAVRVMVAPVVSIQDVARIPATSATPRTNIGRLALLSASQERSIQLMAKYGIATS